MQILNIDPNDQHFNLTFNLEKICSFIFYNHTDSIQVKKFFFNIII